MHPSRRTLLEAAVTSLGAAVLLARPGVVQPPLLFGTTPVILNEQAAFLERWRIYLETLLRRPVTEEAEQALLTLDWPGNACELKHAVERGAILSLGISVGVSARFARYLSRTRSRPYLAGRFHLSKRAPIDRQGTGSM